MGFLCCKLTPAADGRRGEPRPAGCRHPIAAAACRPSPCLIRQGEEGDAYYAVAAGQLDVFQDGRFLRRCGRGEGVGEIALLRAIPRTATVTAHTDATLYKLAREPFLTAVIGHAATQRQAHSIAEARLTADAARGGDSPASGGVEPG
jgi:hypothetical protein